MSHGCSLEDMLQYAELETGRWKQFFASNPELLDLPTDVAGAGTVRALLIHIFSAELYFGNAVQGVQQPDFDALDDKSVDEIFALGEEARGKFRGFLAGASDQDLDTKVSAGPYRPSKRKMIIHAIIHGVRHWAQLATSLRAQGHKQTWQHDFLLSSAME